METSICPLACGWKKAKAELEEMGVEIAMVAEVDDTYGALSGITQEI